MLKRRCRATEAMGLMATAIGKQAVTPMVPHIMEGALKVLFPAFHIQHNLFLLGCLLHACAPLTYHKLLPRCPFQLSSVSMQHAAISIQATSYVPLLESHGCALLL